MVMPAGRMSHNEAEILQEMNKISSSLQSLFCQLQQSNNHQSSTIQATWKKEFDALQKRCGQRDREVESLTVKLKEISQENKDLHAKAAEATRRMTDLAQELQDKTQATSDFDATLSDLSHESRRLAQELDENIEKLKEKEKQIHRLRTASKSSDDKLNKLQKKLQGRSPTKKTPQKKGGNEDTFYKDLFVALELPTAKSFMQRLCKVLQHDGPCNYQEILTIVQKWQKLHNHETVAKKVLAAMQLPADALIKKICGILIREGSCDYHEIISAVREWQRQHAHTSEKTISYHTQVYSDGQWASLGELVRRLDFHPDSLSLDVLSTERFPERSAVSHSLPAGEDNPLKKDTNLHVTLICHDLLSAGQATTEEVERIVRTQTVSHRWGRLVSRVLAAQFEERSLTGWKDVFVSFVHSILLPNIGDSWARFVQSTEILTKRLLFGTKLRDLACRLAGRADFHTIMGVAAQSLRIQPEHFEVEVKELAVLCKRTGQSPMVCAESASSASGALAAVWMMMQEYGFDRQRIAKCDLNSKSVFDSLPFEVSSEHMTAEMVKECNDLRQTGEFARHEKKWIATIEHPSTRRLADVISASIVRHTDKAPQYGPIMRQIEFLERSHSEFFRLSQPSFCNFFLGRLLMQQVARTNYCTASALPTGIVLPLWTKICLSQAEETSRKSAGNQ